MGQKYYIANFKMNKTTVDVKQYFSAFPKKPKAYKDNIIFCPPATALSYTKKLIGNKFELGAQNIHFQNKGAFTGEVSGEMLTDAGAKYVLIGHSERRIYNYESDHTINNKIKAALLNGLIPIVCIGENKNERNEERTNNILSRQINSAIEGIADLGKLIIAYEPIWAIGTGVSATIEDISQVACDIKKIINLPIIYGGSVTEQNANKIAAIPNIDGLLVGNASLDPKKFAKICNLI